MTAPNYGKDFIYGLRAGRELFIDKPRQARHENQRMGLAQDANRRANQEMEWRGEDRQLSEEQREGKQVSDTFRAALWDVNDMPKTPEQITDADKRAVIGAINSSSMGKWRDEHSITGEVVDGGLTPEEEVWLAFDKGDGQLAGYVVDVETFYEDIAHESIRINPEYAELHRQAQERRQRMADHKTLRPDQPGEGLQGGAEARMQGQPQGGQPQGGQPQPPADERPSLSDGVPRSFRNNNPGNLRGEYYGASGNDGGYAVYDSPQAGWDAMEQQLFRYANGDTTGQPLRSVSEIVNTWSPADGEGNSGESTGNYVSAVANRLGVDPDEPLDLRDQATREELMSAMATFEAGVETPYGSDFSGEQVRAGTGLEAQEGPQTYALGPRRELPEAEPIPETPSARQEGRLEGLGSQIQNISSASNRELNRADLTERVAQGHNIGARDLNATEQRQMLRDQQRPFDGEGPMPGPAGARRPERGGDAVSEEFYEDFSDEELVGIYRREAEKRLRTGGGLREGDSPEMRAIEAQMERRGMADALRGGARFGGLWSGAKSFAGDVAGDVSSAVARTGGRIGEAVAPWTAGAQGMTVEQREADRQEGRRETEAGRAEAQGEVEQRKETLLEVGRGQKTSPAQAHDPEPGLAGGAPSVQAGGQTGGTGGSGHSRPGITEEEADALDRHLDEGLIDREQLENYYRNGSFRPRGEWDLRAAQQGILIDPDGHIRRTEDFLGSEPMTPEEQMDQIELQERAEHRAMDVMGIDEEDYGSSAARNLLHQVNMGASARGVELHDYLRSTRGLAHVAGIGEIQKELNNWSPSKWYLPWTWGRDIDLRSTSVAGQLQAMGYTAENATKGAEKLRKEIYAPLHRVAPDLTASQADRYASALIDLQRHYGESPEVAQDVVFQIGKENNWRVADIDRFMYNLQRGELTQQAGGR